MVAFRVLRCTGDPEADCCICVHPAGTLYCCPDSSRPRGAAAAQQTVQTVVLGKSPMSERQLALMKLETLSRSVYIWRTIGGWLPLRIGDSRGSPAQALHQSKTQLYISW